MAYRLIKGAFVVFNAASPASGPQPDGDTIKFQPANTSLVEALPRLQRPPDFNSSGQVNIRFEAIDALEVHFEGAAQGQPLADRARDEMLRAVGFTDFRPLPSFPSRLEHAEPHPLPGHILTRGLDPFGRVVAFVYGGDTAAVDGADLFLDSARADLSVNAALIRAGHAYAGLYTTLPADLRAHFAGLAAAARNAGDGLWPSALAEPDRPPAVIPDRAAAEAAVIWPKLFRRLISYFGSFPTVGLSAFDAWLRDDVVNRDDEFILPGGERVNFHDILAVDPAANTITLTHPSEALTIAPDGQQTGGKPQPGILPSPPIKFIAALPNPAGTDQGRETITLINVTSAAHAIDGWKLANTAGVTVPLTGTIAAGDTRRVTLPQLLLGNDGATLTLIDHDGHTVHQERYRAADVIPGQTVTFPIPGIRP